MWRTVFLILCLLAGPVMADPAAEVRRRIDAAGVLVPDTRETALERVLLLREAEGIVEDVLSSGPPKREDLPLVSPEARAERAALRDAAAKDFALFCEGREPGECLLAEAEALLAEAPEVDRDAEREGAIGPSEAERQIAILLVKAGHFEDAARIAARIADPRDQARAIRDVVLTHLWREGPSPAKRLEDVDEVILKIRRDPAIIAELVTEIASWLIEQGDTELALEILKDAEDFAGFIGNERRRGQALAFIAAEYMELGESDRARALVDQIEDEFWQAAGKKIVAVLLAEAGDFAGAEQVAASIEESEVEQQVEAYASLAESLAAAGQLEEALNVAGRIGKPSHRAAVLGVIAVGLTEASGERAAEVFAEAEALARGIEGVDERVATLATVAMALIKAGNAAAAEDLALTLPTMGAGPQRLSAALEGIAEAHRGAEQGDAALRYAMEAADVVREIDEPEDRSEQGLDLARLLIGLGAYAEAEQVATGIDEPSSRVFALKDLAVALVRSGADQPGRKEDVRRIVALIKGIEGTEEWRGSGLLQVAEALAEAGDVAEAEAAADGIVEPVRRNAAIAGDVISLADGGQLVEAWRIAGQVDDPAWRAVAMVAVAARL
jgi:tetratricopeptide (TPR) repeat protein